MDVSDQATAREEQERALSLQQRRPAGPLACGACHNCDAPLPDGMRFCDLDCRDDWQARQVRG